MKTTSQYLRLLEIFDNSYLKQLLMKLFISPKLFPPFPIVI